MQTMSEEQIGALMQPNWLDRTIARVSPGWGAKRVVARREFAYEAARNTRLRNSAARLQGPEDYSAFPDRLQLIRQMRDLVQNFGLFQSIERKLAMYAFGRIRYQALTGDKRINDLYEDRLAERFKKLDITGRHSLQKLMQIGFMGAETDGDFLFKWQRVGGDLRLVGIEGDRLGGIVMGSIQEDYFQGIKVNPETGQPEFYRIFYRTKADAYVNPQDIPAQDCILYGDTVRIDQYRGITPYAPVINEARDLKELMEATRIGTKFENYHAAVGYTPNGLPLQQPADFITNANSMANGAPMSEQEIKPGLIQWAPSNAKIEFLKSDRPSGQFQTYLESLIRLIANARGLPFGFVYSLSGLAGPGVRMDAQAAHRTIQFTQHNAVDTVLDRVKETLLMDDFANGVLPYVPTWKRGRWQFAPAITIDEGRDSKAMIEEWRTGLRTKASIYAEAGEDSEEQEDIYDQEVQRTVTRAKCLAASQEIPLELALTMYEVRTPNGFVPRSAPEEKVAPDGDTSEIAAPESGSQASFARVKKVRELASAPRRRILSRN